MSGGAGGGDGSGIRSIGSRLPGCWLVAKSSVMGTRGSRVELHAADAARIRHLRLGSGRRQYG